MPPGLIAGQDIVTQPYDNALGLARLTLPRYTPTTALLLRASTYVLT